MKLRYTPIARYVNTVEAVINHCGLRDLVEPVATRPFEAGIDLAEFNPLGTVPTLIRDDASPLYGGPVIYEYLDSLHSGAPLYPMGGEDRWISLRRAWLADGIFDAFVRIIIEAWEPADAQRENFVARQWAKVARGLEAFEREAADFGALDIGQVRAVGAISFVTLKLPPTSDACRFIDPAFDWRASCPTLGGWYERVSANPIFITPLIAS